MTSSAERSASHPEYDAVRGNNDQSPGLRALPELLELEFAGVRILVAHDRKDRRLAAAIARSRKQ